MKPTAGTYQTSGSADEPVRAFIPHALPPIIPPVVIANSTCPFPRHLTNVDKRGLGKRTISVSPLLPSSELV